MDCGSQLSMCVRDGLALVLVLQVRIAAAEQLPVLARGLGPAATIDKLLPELSELLIDDEVQVGSICPAQLFVCRLHRILPARSEQVRQHVICMPHLLQAPAQLATGRLRSCNSGVAHSRHWAPS